MNLSRKLHHIQHSAGNAYPNEYGVGYSHSFPQKKKGYSHSSSLAELVNHFGENNQTVSATGDRRNNQTGFQLSLCA